MTVRQIVEARIPALGWIPRYRQAWFRSDVIAGVTTASVIIPKAMAYATVAGLAVQVGLYTALLPMVAYAALGSSLRLSVSTTTTIGILTAAQIAEFAPNATAVDAAAVATTLSVLVGILLVVTALLRLGFVAQFISEPVLTGFKAGIGVVIVVDQLPKVLGLHVPHASLLQTVWRTVHMLPSASFATMALGLSTIGVMVLLESRAPRAPAPLVGVALGIAASALLGLHALGVDTVGTIPAGLPHVTLPDNCAGARVVGWRTGHRTYQLHRVGGRGTGVRRAGRASARRQSGIAGPRRRQYARRSDRCDALRWRHQSDRRQHQGRRTIADGLLDHGCGDCRRAALPCAADLAHAAGDPGRSRDRDLYRADRPSGIRRNQASRPDRVPLGRRCDAGSDHAGDATGNPGGHRALDGESPAPGQQSRGPHSWPETRH